MHRQAFIVSLGAFATAAAAPRVRSQTLAPGSQAFDLGNQGVLYKLMLDAGVGQPIVFTAAVLPRNSFRAQILEQADQSTALTAVHDLARKSGAVVAINGGPFNGAFAPAGLLIIDGKTVGRKRTDWMGTLTIDDRGNLSVTTEPNLHSARYAVQATPMLIEPGGKLGIEHETNKRERRTVIAQSGDVIVAMVTSSASLLSLAYALIEHPEAFSLPSFDAAINLTGAATTSFYAKLKDGTEVNVPAFWPNRDVITFSAR